MESVSYLGLDIDNERIQELEMQSHDMQIKFTKILVELRKFIGTSSNVIQDIKWILQLKSKIKTVCKSYHGILSSPIETELNEANIMQIIIQYCSFLNYELLETIIDTINFEEGKKLMKSYTEEFMVYARNRVIECPTCLRKAESKECCCYVFLDECFKDYQQIYLRMLKRDISNILKRDIKHFFVHGVCTGSVVVIFHLIMVEISEIFPLHDEQIHSLKTLSYEGAKILEIICGFYDYNINFESRSKYLEFV